MNLKKLKTLGLNYFWGKNYFEGYDGTQNSLVFQVGEKYFKDNSGSDSSSIEIWKSKGLSNRSLSLSGGWSKRHKNETCILNIYDPRPAYVIFNLIFLYKKKKIS